MKSALKTISIVALVLSAIDVIGIILNPSSYNGTTTLGIVILTVWAVVSLLYIHQVEKELKEGKDA